MKKALQYIISFGLAIALIWYVFKDQDINKIVNKIIDANYSFILLSFVTGIISHFARAYRWNLLYNTLGYNPGTGRAFLAVMFGYFMNLVIPRAGEISRCGLLRKTDKIPLEESIGTVVAERAFDLLTIIIIVGLAFLFNYELFSEILTQTGASLNLSDSGRTWIIVVLVLALSVSFVLYLVRRRLMRNKYFAAVGGFLQRVTKGVMSIRHVEKKGMFILSTLLIWVMYFLTSYVVFFAFPATSELGLDVALTLLIVSSLAMIMSVQGGIGAYHLFVTTALIFYGVTEEEALSYATIMHGSTFLLLFVLGAASFFIAAYVANKKQ